jgi:hypothetical protein
VVDRLVAHLHHRSGVRLHDGRVDNGGRTHEFGFDPKMIGHGRRLQVMTEGHPDHVLGRHLPGRRAEDRLHIPGRDDPVGALTRTERLPHVEPGVVPRKHLRSDLELLKRFERPIEVDLRHRHRAAPSAPKRCGHHAHAGEAVEPSEVHRRSLGTAGWP